MLPFVLLMFVPLLFAIVGFNKISVGNGRKWAIIAGYDQRLRAHSLLIPVFFLILWALLALRSDAVGSDTSNYLNHFRYCTQVPLNKALERGIDALFWITTWCIGQISQDPQVYLAVVAAITVIPLAVVYCEDREYGFMKTVMFMNMTTFVMIFSGLRQAIAISMGVIAYELVKRKKLVLFLVVAAIALGFHHSGFIVFLLYPIYHFKIKLKHLWFIVPLIVVVFIFNKQIFGYMAELLTSIFGEDYDLEISETGAITSLMMFILLSVLSYVLPDEKKMDSETFGLRNFLLVAIVFQCFSPVHPLAMRLNYYFIIFIPILVTKIFKYTKDCFKNIEWIFRWAIVGFYLYYYLTKTYESCVTGISSLNTYPYLPFWQ